MRSIKRPHPPIIPKIFLQRIGDKLRASCKISKIGYLFDFRFFEKKIIHALDKHENYFFPNKSPHMLSYN